MTAVEAVPVFVRLLMAFFAAFFGIGLWSKTRDAAWMLVVLGTIFLFIDSLFATLVMLGLAGYNRPTVYGVPVLEPVLAALPPLFIAAGILVFLVRNRRY